MLFEFGDVYLDIPDDYIHVLTDLAFIKGFDVAEKLEQAESLLQQEDVLVELNRYEMLELARLLVEVIE